MCICPAEPPLLCTHVTRGRAGFGKREARGPAEEGGSGSTAPPLCQAATGKHVRAAQGAGAGAAHPISCPTRLTRCSPFSQQPPGGKGRGDAACNPLDAKGTPRWPPSPQTTTMTQRRRGPGAEQLLVGAGAAWLRDQHPVTSSDAHLVGLWLYVRAHLAQHSLGVPPEVGTGARGCPHLPGKFWEQGIPKATLRMYQVDHPAQSVPEILGRAGRGPGRPLRGRARTRAGSGHLPHPRGLEPTPGERPSTWLPLPRGLGTWPLCPLQPCLGVS